MMIQASELRLGNIVQRPEKLRCDILDGGITYYGINLIMLRDCDHYKERWAFEAVPLTHDILKGCGFVSECEGVEWAISLPYGNGSDLVLEDVGAECTLPLDVVVRRDKSKPTDINKPYMYLRPVKYLHQLQNLYFILTGQELSLNFAITVSHDDQTN